MEDSEIIALFLHRDERAITEAKKKYEHGCYKIAYEVLRNHHDAEEAVNAMWFRVWNAIPPAQPKNLFAFLAAAVRNIAVDHVAAENRQKRGGGEIPLALEEMSNGVPSGHSVESELDYTLLRDAIGRFLDIQPRLARMIFVGRYTELLSVKEIAQMLQISESRVKVSLLRTRNRLQKHLKKEGLL